MFWFYSGVDKERGVGFFLNEKDKKILTLYHWATAIFVKAPLLTSFNFC